MYEKMLILKFPRTNVQEPIVCNLAKNFDLTFTILNAAISPRKEGQMVLQLSGSPHNFDEGVRYLRGRGIIVSNAGEEIRRNDEKCVHCGSCTAVCPTGALSIERPEMLVVFDQEKCSICKLCVSVCPPHAMELRPAENGETQPE